MRSFLDLNIDNRREGRIVVELFTDRVPETCKVFQQLCTGSDNEQTDCDGKTIKMHYKNTPVHYVSDSFIIMGDVSKRGGKSGLFTDGFHSEVCLTDPVLPFDEPYMLATAPLQPDVKVLSKKERKAMEKEENAPQEEDSQQTSQFLITRKVGNPVLPNQAELKQKPMVFGRVVKGHAIVNAIAHQSTNDQGKPYPELNIYESGNLEPNQDDNWLYVNGGDPYPYWPEDCFPNSPNQYECLKSAQKVKQVGNEKLAIGHFWFALNKYEKAIRYLEYTSFDNSAQPDVNILKAQCYCNMTLCHLKNKRYHLVISETEKFLETQSINQLFSDQDRAKLLYRKAQAHIQTDEQINQVEKKLESFDLNNVELACADLEEGMKLTSDPLVSQLYQEVRNKVKQRHSNEAGKYAKMFSDKIQEGDSVEVFSSDAVKPSGW